MLEQPTSAYSMPAHDRLPICRVVLVSLFLLFLLTDAQAGEESAKTKNIPEQFLHNATYTVETATPVFWRDFPSPQHEFVDDSFVAFWSRATVKTEASLTKSLRSKIALYTGATTNESELRGVFAPPNNKELYAPYVDFKEANVRYEQKAFAVLLGRAPCNVGLSTLYSPADRYRTLNLVNPMHIDDLGAWQASLDWFMGENTLRFSVLPFEESSPAPHGHSRWVGTAQKDFQIESSVSQAGGIAAGATGLFIPPLVTPRTALRNRPGFLAKYSGVATGLDYFASAHVGPSIYSVMQNPSPGDFVIEIPYAATFSAGLTFTRGPLEVHAESPWQVTAGGDDQDFLRYVIGASYRETTWAEGLHLNEITPVVEYAGEWVTDQQHSPGVSVDSTNTRPFRNTLLFKMDVMANDKCTASVGGIRNFTSRDYAQAIGLEYKPNYNLTLKLHAVFFGGPSNSPFGRWDRNDHLEISAKKTF